MPDRTDIPARCTAVRTHGRFCDRESLPGTPFPICLKHATTLLQYLNDRVTERGPVLQVAEQLAEVDRPNVRQHAPVKMTWRGTSVVYYLRVSGYIKIGHTMNLPQRLRAYPPDTELLALEQGTRELERRRLKEFARYKQAALEWFEPGPLLLQHIKSLQVAAA